MQNPVAASCDAKVVSFPSELQQHGPSYLRAAGMRWADSSLLESFYNNVGVTLTSSRPMTWQVLQFSHAEPIPLPRGGSCQGRQKRLKTGGRNQHSKKKHVVARIAGLEMCASVGSTAHADLHKQKVLHQSMIPAWHGQGSCIWSHHYPL